MIDSVLEFIARAASSSAFIFCFCNLIIVIILIDLKPSLSLDQGSEIPVSVIRNTAADDKQERNSKCVVEGNKRSGETRGVSTPQEEQALAMDEVDNEDNHGCSNEEKVKAEEYEDEDEDEDDNDELRRRVEEFIEKVNKAWKAEVLNTSNLM